MGHGKADADADADGYQQSCQDGNWWHAYCLSSSFVLQWCNTVEIFRKIPYS